MREKIKILSEVLKQNTAITERWKKEISEKWFLKEAPENIDEIIDGIIPLSIWYHDILEYLWQWYWISANYLTLIKPDFYDCETEEVKDVEITLSPWALSEQSDSTLDDIISLCKNKNVSETNR